MELSWFVFLIIGIAIGTIYGSRQTDEYWKERLDVSAKNES